MNSNVKNINKAIHDVGWSIFINCLNCKAEEAGKIAIGIDPKYTSQKCSGCGIMVLKKLSEREHICTYCDLKLDRDHNAAINILMLGGSIVRGQDVRA